MNKQPLVSVVITTYNRTKYIKRAVESVLAQTYKNIEIIIIDDNSTDGTYKIISEFNNRDLRIVILKNKTNLGSYRSLNKGIRISKGTYIANLDDDDIWFDVKKIEKQVNFLEEDKNYGLVGGGVIKIDEDGKEIIRYLSPENDKEIRKTILIDNAFAHSTVLFRKEVWEKVGGYNKLFDYAADIDLWLKIGKISKFYNFQEYFIYYLEKEQDNDHNMRNDSFRRKVRLNIKLRRRHRNHYPGYGKAFLLCWASYFYSFLPFRQRLRPILFKLRKLILGPPSYKYFKKN